MFLNRKINLFLIFLVVILVFSFVLRFQNLGYSDYQGDEIKAFFNPKQDGNFAQFLLDQRKGPNQFLVTGAIKGITNNYENYFLTRLPFAIAGFLSVILFYLTVSKIFSKNVAILSTIFFATNGFLVAFSRLVQYQAFVILFGILAIYLYLLYRNTHKYKYIYLSLISLATSVLFHYDGLFFGILIFFWGINDLIESRKKGSFLFLKHAIGSGVVFLATLASFYVPFVLNISEATKDYWLGRISGDVSNKISSSYYLFTVYQPIYAIHFYLLLIALGVFVLFFPIFYNRIKYIQKLKIKEKPIFSYDLLFVFLWALIPFLFLEVYVYIPGTHIYTYLIPAFILMGYGINFVIHNLIIKFLRYASYLGAFLLFLFLALQSYTIYVDHNKEYPWQEKKFLFFTLNRPTPIFHLSMFGFPYNRNWQEVGEFINNSSVEYFSTNERVSITRYYISKDKDGEKLGLYVWIENPQSFTNDITNKRVNSFVKTNEPIKEITTKSGNKVKIYFVPESYKEPKIVEEIIK